MYRARDLATGAPAAIKVLAHDLAQSIRMIQRFAREVEALDRIAHPNIVKVFELGELLDGRPYIAMEWLEGRTLGDELGARGPFTSHEVLAIMDELGGAVAAAHALGVIHRDIKAQNLIAVPAGDWFTLKLVDFGIAKLVESGVDQAFTIQTIMGTPEAMAPEQIRGGAVDERTDIYAMGVLLFQLVTGRLPFAGASIIELQDMHLYAAPPRASTFSPVPAALDPVLARAMAKEPSGRFASVDELLQATRAALAGADTPLCGIGVYIELGHARPGGELAEAPTEPPGENIDDRIDDLIDEIIGQAEELLAAAGLAPVMQMANALLAAAPLAGSDDGVLRSAVVSAALAIETYALARDPARLLTLRIVVHVAGIELAPDQQAIAGGELMRLGQWPRPLPADSSGVFASRAILGEPDGPRELADTARQTRATERLDAVPADGAGDGLYRVRSSSGDNQR